LMVFASSTAMAASKKKNTGYTAASGKVYYYDSNGKRVKDCKKKINGKFYYFDEKGVQRTGWQKIGNNYYYFKIAKRKKGYMVTSATVNGITLKANGKAKMTSYSKQKLPILYKANVMMQSITKCTDTKKEKLRKCFDYTRSYLSYAGLGSFHNQTNWDLYYATRIFVNGSTTGDCYTYAVMFAYLANAVGYQVNAVSSGGHGWAEIGNYVYDPDWQMADSTHDYCGLPYGTTGRNVPNYANNRWSVIAI
ncbi:MAG: hypothetical protein LIO94_13700, partial [Clostridiales bacterium]|nr:hypothetical protein [Clostridiales bacterium]